MGCLVSVSLIKKTEKEWEKACVIFRVHEKELGGGIMLDIGHYSVHLATLVFGAEKPEKVPSTFQQLFKRLTGEIEI